MESLLIVCIAVAFLGLLGLNIYFRARVLKAYRLLVRGRVEFDATDMLSQEKIEKIVRENPAHEQEIRAFTGGIRRSMSLATLLILLITCLGAVLMWYR